MARDHSRPPQASYETDGDRWAEQREAEAKAEADALQQKYLQKIHDGTYTSADYRAYTAELLKIQDRFTNDLIQHLREHQVSPE